MLQCCLIAAHFTAVKRNGKASLMCAWSYMGTPLAAAVKAFSEFSGIFVHVCVMNDPLPAKFGGKCKWP